MYRILIASDTHRHIEYVCRAVKAIDKIDLIIHLGDLCTDMRDLESLYPQYEWVGVRGNNDFFDTGDDERVLERAGVKMFLTHGHAYSVRGGVDALVRRAKALEANAVFFGHTHVRMNEMVDGVLCVNPGGYNTMPYPGVMVAEIEDGKLRVCPYIGAQFL